jgi:formylglycine-generating enzyme required for sulfatase activity
MRYLVFSSLVVISALSGCSLYYESQAKDMVQRQMDAMVFVEGGEFMMGNPGGWSIRNDTIPAHRVVVDDFHIQKYEVTQGDFELFMEVTDYKHSNDSYEILREEHPERFQSNLPAVVSWTDASEFCRWLGSQTDKNIRLPTEAQWEYAARGGGKPFRYATENGAAEEGVTMAARPSQYRRQKQALPQPPGSYPPNLLGLHDMSGNAAEWVRDYYRADYYERSPVNNPKGPESPIIESWSNEPYRILRGGDFKDFSGNTTVTRRKAIERVINESTGFRCSFSKSLTSEHA